VIAGLAASSGLPAAAGCVEVATSNLSKANPSTGVIDVDPSGKWIKGANYVAPNLGRVIDAHVRAIEADGFTSAPMR
jgi:hypothetical protein